MPVAFGGVLHDSLALTICLPLCTSAHLVCCCWMICTVLSVLQELARLADANLSAATRQARQERERRAAAELAAKLVGKCAWATCTCNAAVSVYSWAVAVGR